MKNARNRKRRKGTITRNSRSRLPSGFARSQTSVADLTLDYLFPLLYDSLLPLRYSPTLSGGSFPTPCGRFALCRMIIYPNAPFFGDFARLYKRRGTGRVKSRRYLHFSLLLILSLFSASIDFNFSRVHAVATPRKYPASILVKFAKTRLSIYFRRARE